jgi:UDP-N-acetylmuramoyl-tripeptide--D-alanyl-D-alanine ligase
MIPTIPALRLRTGELEEVTGGAFIGREREVCIHGAAIDSRRVTPGCVFACFEGERVDGHDYAATAVGSGAGLVIASRPVPDIPVGVLQVADVGLTLRRLAACYRQKRQEVIWIGVTGSNGKTTVKEMLRAVCALAGPVHATAGNYNNHLGVPLTILNTPQVRYAVVELGASARGEIDMLAEMLQPDYGVITCIGPAHLLGFGGLEGVARGKAELLRHCRQEAVVSLCGSASVAAAYSLTVDDLADIMQKSAATVPLQIMRDHDCDAGIASLEPPALQGPDGPVVLAMPGRHSLNNAVLVLTVARLLDIDRTAALDALAAVPPVAGRLRMHAFQGHRLFDDSYNANPASMEAGLQVLSREPGARLVVLGDMGELGAGSEDLHRQVGASAARLGLPLIGVGSGGALIVDGYRQAGGRDSVQTDDHEETVQAVCERLRVGPTAVLVKASRSAALDKVVHILLDRGMGEVACSAYSNI